jgi:hypothetical protein
MANIAFKTRDAFLLNNLKLQMSVVVPTLNMDTVCHSHAKFRVDEIITVILNYQHTVTASFLIKTRQ